MITQVKDADRSLFIVLNKVGNYAGDAFLFGNGRVMLCLPYLSLNFENMASFAAHLSTLEWTYEEFFLTKKKDKRELATLRRINEISPILGADNIVIARIDGWQCIVKKDEFRPGDIGVYFEIDSFLPIEDRYEFLRKSSYKNNEFGEGFRLKTIKMKGVQSQGLILPVMMFPELQKLGSKIYDLVGLDVTALLGVKKYEKPSDPCAKLRGDILGEFPRFIRKSDQERIQNVPNIIHTHIKTPFEITTKLDGSSMTIFHRDGATGVCSRNVQLKKSAENAFWIVAKELEIIPTLVKFGKNIALQGELVGPGIQRNHEQLESYEFYLFDIWDIDQQKYLLPDTRKNVLEEINKISPVKIKHVPVLGIDTISEIVYQCPDNDASIARMIDKILFFAEGESINPRVRREGIVFKSMDYFRGEVVSFKAIANSYYAKDKD